MLRMTGSQIATNIASQISKLLYHFSLIARFSYAITNNALENSAYIAILNKELSINPSERYILCISYIINLVAYEVLFRSDVEAFELELKSNIIAEIVKLAT
jgi:hypothetical protein